MPNKTIPAVDPEKWLWLRVIRRAQEEAEGQHLYGSAIENLRLKRAAVKWLTLGTKSFMRVCEMAGLNEDEICALIKHNKETYGRA